MPSELWANLRGIRTDSVALKLLDNTSSFA